MTLDERLGIARDDYRALTPPTELAPTTHAPARPRRHRRSAVALGVLVVALVGGVALRAGDDRSGQVRTSTPTTSTPVVDDVIDIAPEDPAIVVEPDGPYSDGQEVTVSIPPGFAQDFYNGGVGWCATYDRGSEVCDSLFDRGWPDPTNDARHIRVVRRILSPDGWIDCADPGVTCRFVIERRSEEFAASAPVRFVGDPTPGPRLDVRRTDTPGRFELDGDGLPSNVSYGLTLCAFGPTEHTPGPYGADLWYQGIGGVPSEGPLPSANCFGYGPDIALGPDDPNALVVVDLPRTIYGYEGWNDCAHDQCFLAVSGSPEDWPGKLTAALVPFDRSDPLPDRPAIRILTEGPFVSHQEITVEVSGLYAGQDSSIGLCTVQRPWSCGYIGVTFGLTNGQLTFELPELWCLPDECYLELGSRGEGMPPLATVPLPVPTPAPPADG